MTSSEPTAADLTSQVKYRDTPEAAKALRLQAISDDTSVQEVLRTLAAAYVAGLVDLDELRAKLADRSSAGS